MWVFSSRHHHHHHALRLRLRRRLLLLLLLWYSSLSHFLSGKEEEHYTTMKRAMMMMMKIKSTRDKKGKIIIYCRERPKKYDPHTTRKKKNSCVFNGLCCGVLYTCAKSISLLCVRVLISVSLLSLVAFVVCRSFFRESVRFSSSSSSFVLPFCV